jgi:hypothetical protein
VITLKTCNCSSIHKHVLTPYVAVLLPGHCCRFKSSEQVEFLARCVHTFDPVTDQPLPDATALGGLVVQVSL